MKRLSPKTICIFSSRCLSINAVNKVEIHQHGLRISHFSTSSNSFHSSPSSSYQSRRHEEESRNVRVSVWWDFENCTLPAGANVFKVSQRITAAIRANGIKGPIQITAFGDVLQLSRSNQEALSSTGINLTHIPHGGKSSADRSLLVDLMYWVSQNPPPAHLFLISGDRDFASILHRLRMNNYNILLASPETTPGVLCSAASIMWHWNVLVKGENLTGKYFNQPPDGPYGSWYGHYKVPLEDPFTVTEQSACSRAEVLSEFGSDTKLRPVPKVVVKQIRDLLNLYPKGISITDLRSELGKSNVTIDKDLYGYKKFSRFLLSMPHILKLQSGGEGQFLVCSIAPKVPEPVESSPGMSKGPVANNGASDFAIAPKLTGEDNSSSKVVDETSLPPSPEPSVKEPPKKLQEQQTELQEPPPLVEKVNNADVTESHLHPLEEHGSISEVGFFKWIWRKWFGAVDGGSEKKSCNKAGNSSMSHGSTESTRTEDSCLKSIQSADQPASFCSSGNEAVTDDKTAGSYEAYGDKSSRGPGFYSQITSWCKFWRRQNSDYSKEQSSEKLNQTTIDSGKHEIFLKESFWNNMEAFIDTPNFSVLVSQFRTRKQMAQHLQKQGPLVLSSLNESDLLHLVDLLISEKKWVGECPSQTYPFKVIPPVGKSSTSSNPCHSNGLSAIFLSEPLSQRLPEYSGEKRHPILPSTGISPRVISKKPIYKSRSKILADCQKLVCDIVKEHPQGFNIGSFRKLFLERYGYSLDAQKLGYQKVSTLLQMMPGVKIESTYIIPSGKFSKNSILEATNPNVQENNTSFTVANSNSELSDSSRRDDDLDSPWEELGPVANTSPQRNEIEMRLSRKVKQTVGQIHHDYESLSDDDVSDSEEDTSSSTGSVGQGKPRVNEADSSLLQILDSWYSSKEENNRGDGSQNVDGMVDSSENVFKLSGSSGIGITTVTPEVNNGQKPRPFKSYSFVSDQPGDNEDKLIDGILGSLKKSGESRVQG
ncbi:hypothetical protein F0562_005712 [Nyssa sinensis]|uniref:HTH OST-type domain-containing protein n=1 Tax=Nyssa sinensis TaxID=561372 RepID=A0A5J5ANK6_9ASTE|nr:hypothetical protein F0562_005712 [Nyssa sinensis]